MDKPILAYSRITGEPLALVPSASEPNVYYLVTADACSCKSFQFRGRCRHLSPPAVYDGPVVRLVRYA
jgi:hypothetical protein